MSALRALIDAASPRPWFDKTTVGYAHLVEFGDLFADHDEATDKVAFGRRVLARLNGNYPRRDEDSRLIVTLANAANEVDALVEAVGAALTRFPARSIVQVGGDATELVALRAAHAALVAKLDGNHAV